MLTSLEAATRLSRGYGGKVHGDVHNGDIDVEFPDVHRAASFAHMMIPTQNEDGYSWLATCELRDPVTSLTAPVTLTVTMIPPTTPVD